MSLGSPYLNGFVEDIEGCGRWPLNLVWCQECGLGQLSAESPPDWHFRNYWYRSGITQTMRQELAEITKTTSFMTDLKAGDTVIDIGANDGTLLRSYPEMVVRIGFEPALNLQEEARRGGNKIIPEYFSADIVSPGQKAKIVTAISMFYDLAEPLKFLKHVKEVLSMEGVFVLQMNYAKSMIENTAFDNICHEHLTYYTLVPLLRLLDQAELFPFKGEVNDINGGSLRLYCRHKVTNKCQTWHNSRVDEDGSVDQLLMEESRSGINKYSTWASFAERVREYGLRIKKYLVHQAACSDEIWLYGASTRGSTLCQYWGLDKGLIEGAAERDERKIGKMTTGTWIPIFGEEKGRKEADIFVVLPWHFRKEILNRESDWIQKGGKMLIPLPVPCVVTKDMVRYL